MIADPAGWPDPARPGYPLHPERDGWHWMLVTHGIGHAFPMLWDAGGRMWDAGDAGWTLAEDIATRWRYLGPCILPADLAAERDAARAEAARLREALTFYANPQVYAPHPHGPAFDRRDLSWHARAALAGEAGRE